LPYKYWDSAISYNFFGFGGEEIETKISEIWAPARWRGTKKDTLQTKEARLRAHLPKPLVPKTLNPKP
jgi:hypothetical protein